MPLQHIKWRQNHITSPSFDWLTSSLSCSWADRDGWSIPSCGTQDNVGWPSHMSILELYRTVILGSIMGGALEKGKWGGVSDGTKAWKRRKNLKEQFLGRERKLELHLFCRKAESTGRGNKQSYKSLIILNCFAPCSAVISDSWAKILAEILFLFHPESWEQSDHH